MLEFFRRLLSADGFMPHGHCYLWQPGVLWLHLLSDAFVALAYTSIPFTLLYFVRKRRDLPFNGMFICFGCFIIACGATHVMEIVTIWRPMYWLAGVIKAITAVASVATAILLVRLVPRALRVPTVAQLEYAHAELRAAHAELEARVFERTAELVRKNEELAKEIADHKRTVDALAISESQFRRLSESGIVGIVRAEPGGKVLEANDTFLKLTGYDRKDLALGRIRSELLRDPTLSSARDAVITQLVAFGSTQPEETRIIREDGTPVPVLVGTTMLDRTTCISIILDLTDQKRAEAAIKALKEQHEADARFRALVEAAPEAMVITDRAENIVLMNAEAERLFGYPRADLANAPLTQIVQGGHGVRKGGEQFIIEVSESPIQTEDSMLISRTVRDVTARKYAEEELMRARDAAEVASRELEAFSYSVAHDLRAPLRSINGYAAVLIDDLEAQLSTESKTHLQRIQAGATRMAELIDALLRLARLSRAELVDSEVDLAALGEEVIAQLRAHDPDRLVDIDIAQGMHTRGDRQLLLVVLENLIGNAWKFTAKTERARIELGQSPDGYFIRDNGAGFDMAYAQKLFTPFQRLHAAKEFAGTGIGLATVQRIVQRHGGRVWAEGVVGHGATFHFTLGSR